MADDVLIPGEFRQPPSMRKIRVHTVAGPYFDILVADPLTKFAFGVRSIGYIQASEMVYIPHASIAAMVDITDMKDQQTALPVAGMTPAGTA
jgi:hypothetical protein